jgi:hypothetical protein
MTIWVGMFGATYSMFARGNTEHVPLSSSMNTGKGWDLTSIPFDAVRQDGSQGGFDKRSHPRTRGSESWNRITSKSDRCNLSRPEWA